MICDKIITVITKHKVKIIIYIVIFTKLKGLIIILFRKITATALACLLTTVSAAGYFENGDSIEEESINNSQIGFSYSIKAEAANLTKPTIKLHSKHGDKINITLTNYKKYKVGTKFNVYVNDKLARKNVDIKKIKADKGYIYTTNDGNKFYKSNTNYKIKVKAVKDKDCSSYSSTLKAKTNKTTYFSIKKNAQLYQLKKSKMTKSSKLSGNISVKGKLVNKKGSDVSGKSIKNNNGEYIKITEGKYKGKFVKISENKIHRISESTYKKNIVVSYASSMNGGRYVYGGSKYRATDCSGLVMLSYKQIGVNLPHSARQMRNVGKAVSRSKMQAGDIIVMNGGSHVGMYIGNNKIVHAMNSRDGIKIQSASNLKYYSVNTVRRIV